MSWKLAGARVQANGPPALSRSASGVVTSGRERPGGGADGRISRFHSSSRIEGPLGGGASEWEILAGRETSELEIAGDREESG